MSLEDGDKINKSFQERQKIIDSLKLKVDSSNKDLRLYMIHNGARLQSMYNSYMEEKSKNDNLRIQRDSAVAKYMANKKIYETREKDFNLERRHQQIFTSLVLLFTFVLAGIR